MKALLATYIKLNTPGVFCVEKARDRNRNGSSHAGLLLYSVKEAAEATEKLKDVSGNIQAGQVILVDAGHGGIDSGW